MAQITIYMPDELERAVRGAAKAEGTSVSNWIAGHLGKTFEDQWPKAVLDAAGAIPDFPSVDAIRKKQGRDVPRETLR